MTSPPFHGQKREKTLIGAPEEGGRAFRVCCAWLFRWTGVPFPFLNQYAAAEGNSLQVPPVRANTCSEQAFGQAAKVTFLSRTGRRRQLRFLSAQVDEHLQIFRYLLRISVLATLIPIENDSSRNGLSEFWTTGRKRNSWNLHSIFLEAMAGFFRHTTPRIAFYCDGAHKVLLTQLTSLCGQCMSPLAHQQL
jgi:hypothetical protein